MSIKENQKTMLNLLTFAQTYSYTTTSVENTNSGVFVGAMLVYILIVLAVTVLMVAALWKIFKKADKPGWAAIVPVYNEWVLFEIVGYPGWWALLTFIPFVNIFPAIMALVAYFKLAKLFGKSDVFAVMNILFPFVTLPMLGFGSAQFQGETASASPVGPQAPVAPAPVAAAPVAPVAENTAAPEDQTPSQQPPVTPVV